MAQAAVLRTDSFDAVEALADKGWLSFPDGVDRVAAQALLARIRAARAFDHRLFLTEAEFDADPLYVGVNPRPGRNLLERFDWALSFVEEDPDITAALTDLLGPGYGMLDRKLVCGVPRSVVPAWVLARIEGRQVNNLGPYVRPEYRDLTYFMGIDFHQDLIDHKARAADFVTLYVYLHAVGPADAPLHLLEASHRRGGTRFPHDVERLGDDLWRYGDLQVRQQRLTGPAGQAMLWHACTLHGTQPDDADHERISLRYLFAKGSDAPAGIDAVNAGIDGPLSLETTRQDLGPDGQTTLRAPAKVGSEP